MRTKILFTALGLSLFSPLATSESANIVDVRGKFTVVEVDGKLPSPGNVELYDKGGKLKGTLYFKQGIGKYLFLKNGETATEVEKDDTLKFSKNFQRFASVALLGGWTRVEEKWGFGGDRTHFGLDLHAYFCKHLFLQALAYGVDMGTSSNTKLNQNVFLLGPGFRYQGFHVSLGLGRMLQSKLINTPGFSFVDPAPKKRSDTFVNDSFWAWGVQLGYDFKLYQASSSFPWSFAIGPHLAIHDAVENNGFKPLVSTGISLRLL